jgi:hypothetical protein
MQDLLKQAPVFIWVLFILMVWSFVWKGLALWQAARNGHKGWFVALLLINTLGILEILYIYIFGKQQKSS